MPKTPQGMIRIADVAQDVGLSPTRIRQLADAGIIPSERTSGGHRTFNLAAVRAALARRSLTAGSAAPVSNLGAPDWQREISTFGLAEDQVWRRIAVELGIDSGSSAQRVMSYAFMEMLNNAIDHSRSETVDIAWWKHDDSWAFEIKDRGVGVFINLRHGLMLQDVFEAVQELTKGKRTTDPDRHTGEGIFFTSKVVDLFQLTSAGIRWTVDNLRGDVALGSVADAPGTVVFCQIDPNTDRQLADVFHQFSRNNAFVRTRPAVKLFGLGLTFVSRSEARRLLDGLDQRFEEVEVDFAGVDDVGQGFVDELLRVWPATHPGKTVTSINMNPAVEFMVRRGLARAQENHE
jgi:anti-sigma regulatory factor (Ser/Thr protein kinase)